MSVPQTVLDAEQVVSSFLSGLSAAPPPPPPPPVEPPEFLLEIGYAKLFSIGTTIVFQSGMQIDADGSPQAYHPTSSKGLDALGNAGRPGNWWGIATSNGKASGKPVIQGVGDPAPGFYVSTTALEIAGFTETQQQRYINASIVPFIVLPSGFGCGTKLGDLVFCYNVETGDNNFGMFADIGPRGQIGEASIAMASSLRVPHSPRTGGTAGGIVTIIWPGSGKGYQENAAVLDQGGQLLRDWGGLAKVKELVSEEIL